jgi:predicted AlkP superfamily pyrophosphatase or phosphodiesterase
MSPPLRPRPTILFVCALAIAVVGTRLAARPAVPAPAARSADRAQALILLSFDGWRWDYHTKADTPNLRRLMQRGVHAERLIPVFPTKTFPNHYSLVTGLYPAHHGIVGNTMREPGTTLRFTMADRDMVGDSRWWGGEPLWVTAKRQGLRTATLFWPGSEAAIAGMRPDIWSPYDGNLPNEVRVDRMLEWLDLPPDTRPAFITGYFNDADNAGHNAGPESPEVRQAITRLDAMLGRLVRGLEARDLVDRVALVIVSDHGMAERRSNRVITLADYIDVDRVEIVELDPHVGLYSRDGNAAEIHARLAKAHPRLRVYLSDRTPEHWHYRGHPRIPEIVGVSDEGWAIEARRTPLSLARRRVSGNHGYDPRVRSMHGLFVAAGPGFRQGVTVAPFEAVHVYNALVRALGLEPSPNDGDPAIARLVNAPQERRALAAPAASR